MFLSQDTVALAELLSNEDIHEKNRVLLGLPSRLIAKTFLFRLIYGGSCWAYAQDPEFTHVSSDPDFWQRVIDEFYSKYTGLARWHNSIVEEAIREGCLTVPSGRRYEFSPYRDKRGDIKWPRTTILNYPVQGFSADLMMIARISTRKRLARYGGDCLLVNTVHDDIELDVNEKKLDNGLEMCYNICLTMEQVFRDVPMNFEKLYGIEFNVPLIGELSFGKNLKEMVEFNQNKGVDQFGSNDNPDY